MTDHTGANGERTDRMLPRLRQDHPRWRIWASDTGRLYATRAGISVDEPGASVTVDGLTSADLRAAIACAEGLAVRFGTLAT